MHPDGKPPIREWLCAVRLPPDQAAEARTRLKREQGADLTPESQEMAEFVVLFTTLPRDRLMANGWIDTTNVSYRASVRHPWRRTWWLPLALAIACSYHDVPGDRRVERSFTVTSVASSPLEVVRAPSDCATETVVVAPSASSSASRRHRADVACLAKLAVGATVAFEQQREKQGCVPGMVYYPLLGAHISRSRRWRSSAPIDDMGRMMVMRSRSNRLYPTATWGCYCRRRAE